MRLTRRGFLGGLLASPLLAWIKPAQTEALTPYYEDIVIDQMRGPHVWPEQLELYKDAAVDVNGLRAAMRAQLAQWMADRMDQMAYEQLTKG